MSDFLLNYGLIFIGIFCDGVFNVFLPNTFGYESFIITPLFGFVALMLVIRKMPLKQKCVVGLIYALFLEFQKYDTNYLYLISICIFCYLSESVWRIGGGSMLEKAIILFSLVSFHLFFRYGFARIFNMTHASLLSFITYEFILTMFFNLIAIFILLYLESIFNDRSIQKERIKKRNERLNYWN